VNPRGRRNRNRADVEIPHETIMETLAAFPDAGK
jgi:hypothetical protein